MATKTYKPTTPSRRNMVTPSFAEITKKKPEKNLVTVLKKNAGRNNTGRITVRHHGGGNRQKYRIIDFKRNADVTNKVIAIEYDPNRTAYIALLEDENAKRSYVIAPNGLSVGDVLYSGEQRASAFGHPRRYLYPCDRALSRPRRTARPLRGRSRAAYGQGGRQGTDQASLRRGQTRASRLQGYNRPGGKS